MIAARGVFITPFLIGVALLLGGCYSSGMGDLDLYVKEVKARKPQPLEPIPEIKHVETFLYVPGGRRDPFEPEAPQKKDTPTTDAGPGSGVAPDPFRRKEDLETVPLDTLRMVGTLRQQDAMWGLIKTKDGIIHRVKVGNYLGDNHGQIMRISEEGLELIEIVPDGKGGYRERRASVALSGEARGARTGVPK
jgi:type IV pilus assembly protein PilP